MTHTEWKATRTQTLQTLGQQLVNHLHTYLRALQLYTPDNDIFQRPLAHIHQAIHTIFQHEGQVSLYGHQSTIMLNDILLRFPTALLPSVHFLLRTWEQHESGGFTITQAISQEQLRLFLQQFSANQPPPAHAQQLHGIIRTEALKHIRMKLSQTPEGELQRLTSMKVDPKQYAILLYSRLLQLVQRNLQETTPHTKTNNQITRTLQELIDLCETEKMTFLGFTNESDPRAYESYHICNTVFFAILFGWHLGLDRIQLLHMAQATIHHTRGKQQLPQSLLDKSTPLSPEEKRDIRSIGVHSVQAMLQSPFSWDTIRQAIIIAGIYEPGIPLPHTPQHPLATLTPSAHRNIAQSPWLYSHIIRLCGTFDALSTRRPFRVKLYPAEALKLMHEHLLNSFEPYLLWRFVGFFGPMAIQHRPNPHAPLHLPNDPRLTQDFGETNSPFGKKLQNEFKRYWTLRTKHTRSEAEDQQLSKLRQKIRQQTQTKHSTLTS